MRWWWEGRSAAPKFEGVNLPDAAAVKRSVGVPVLCAGGFQTASRDPRGHRGRGASTGSRWRGPLLANPDLPKMFAEGLDRAPRPCTYCNKCLVNFVENPLGCYDESRFDSREQMIEEIMSVFDAAGLQGRRGAARTATR